jgi:hypothetical protein
VDRTHFERLANRDGKRSTRGEYHSALPAGSGARVSHRKCVIPDTHGETYTLASSEQPKCISTRSSAVLLLLLLSRWWHRWWVLELLRSKSRLAVADHLPRTRRLKVAEGLRKLQGLIHDALVFFRVADFGVPGEREVFAQRVAFEAVIGKDATPGSCVSYIC